MYLDSLLSGSTFAAGMANIRFLVGESGQKIYHIEVLLLVRSWASVAGLMDVGPQPNAEKPI